MPDEKETAEETHARRKREGLKGVLDALDRVSKRKGYQFRILYVAPDSSHVGIAFARAHDTNAVRNLESHSAAPSLELNWGEGNEVKLVDNVLCDNGESAIRVEFTVNDSGLETALIDELFGEINSSQVACLVARWTIRYLERVVLLFRQRFQDALTPFGWQVGEGNWLQFEMEYSNDKQTWESYIYPPRDSRTESIRIFLHPFGNRIVIQPPNKFQEEENVLRIQAVDALKHSYARIRSELEETPLWKRGGFGRAQHPGEANEGERQAKKIGENRKRGMNSDTRLKLVRLAKIRAERTTRGEVNIAWTAACELVGIDPETASKHNPELRGRWLDASYAPEFAE